MKYVTSLFLILVVFLFIPTKVQADDCQDYKNNSAHPNNNSADLKEAAEKCGLQQVGDVSDENSLKSSIQDVINTLLFVSGVAAIIIIVIGGFRFVTSEGDSQAANKARNTVIYAAVGLVVAVMSYAIINFILDQL